MKCKIVSRALYDYVAQSGEELEFHEGDILLITDDTDVDWWMAIEKPVDTFQEARSGLVPATYVEEMPPVCHARALYDYEPNTEDEIPMREGDYIRVYDRSDADWWFVKQDHDVGLVPATYLQEDSEISSVPPVEVQGEASKEVSKEEPPSIDPAAQKNMLLSALGGFGFAKPKEKERTSTAKEIIQGPEDALYIVVAERRKKKRGLVGYSAVQSILYFCEEHTREVILKIAISEITGIKEKKTKMMIDYAKESFEFEGEKKDICNVFGKQGAILHPPVVNVVQPLASLPARGTTVNGKNSQPPPITPSPASMAPPKVAVAMYDYDPAAEGELAIREGEKLFVLDESDPDWALVRHVAKKASEGLVPKTYIEVQKPLEGSPTNQVVSEDLSKRLADQNRFQEEADRKAKLEEERRSRDEQEAAELEATRQRLAAARPSLTPRPVEAPAHRPSLTPRPVEAPAPRPIEFARPVESVPVAPPMPPRLPTRSVEAPPMPDRAAPALPSRGPASTSIAAAAAKKAEESAAKAKLATSDKPDPSEMRQWTDRSGSFKVEAAFISIGDNKVHLHKSNGVKIAVPIEKLDPTDVAYLRQKTGDLSLGSAGATPAPPKLKSGQSLNALNSDDNRAYIFNGFNWRDWLIKAGVASSDAGEYAKKFVNQRMDQSILGDIDRDALRAIGITEGDIIRIRKSAGPSTIIPQVNAREREAESRNLDFLASKLKISGSNSNLEQVKSDEAYARELQNQEVRRASNVGNTARKSTINSKTAPVNMAALQQAGQLLNAVSKKPSPPTSTRGSIGGDVMFANQFAAPPSTAEVSSALSLGLKHVSVPSAHDPWGAQKPSGFNTNTPFNQGMSNVNPVTNATQESLLKAQQQQEEAQRTLMAAQQAILKAQEQAKQAAILQEQNKAAAAAQMQQAHTQAALSRAQETARQAQLIQQQAEQALLNAQKGAVNPPHHGIQNNMFANQGMFQPGMNVGYQQQQQPVLPRPTLSAPLIPTPSASAGNFNRPSFPSNPQQNWNQPLQNQNNDRYAVFKETNPAAPSIFNTPQSAAPPFPSSQGSFNQPQQGSVFNQPSQGSFNQPPQGSVFNQPPQGSVFNQPAPQGSVFNQPTSQGGFNQPTHQAGFNPSQGMFNQHAPGFNAQPGFNQSFNTGQQFSGGLGIHGASGPAPVQTNQFTPGLNMGLNPQAQAQNRPGFGMQQGMNNNMMTPQQLLYLQQQQQQQQQQQYQGQGQGGFGNSQYK